MEDTGSDLLTMAARPPPQPPAPHAVDKASQRGQVCVYHTLLYTCYLSCIHVSKHLSGALVQGECLLLIFYVPKQGADSVGSMGCRLNPTNIYL